MEYEIELLNREKVSRHRDEIICLMRELCVFRRMDDLSYCIAKYEDMLHFLEDSTAIIIGAVKEEQLIAYTWGYCKGDRIGNEKMHITQIVVQRQYRNSGIGKMMIEYMQDYSRKRNWKGIEMNVSRVNYHAQHFYRVNGFFCEQILLSKNIVDKQQRINYKNRGGGTVCS